MDERHDVDALDWLLRPRRPQAIGGPYLLRNDRHRRPTVMNTLLAFHAVRHRRWLERRGRIPGAVIAGASRFVRQAVAKAIRHHKAARKQFGRSLSAQLLDMARAWWVTDLKPAEYYHALLARHGGSAAVCRYVDGGVLHGAIITLQYDLFGPPPFHVNDKAAFGAWCYAQGLPHPRGIVVAADGPRPTTADLDALGPGLIVKPRQSRRGRNVSAWRRVDDRFVSKRVTLAADRFAGFLTSLARVAPPGIVVQTRLRNHADVAACAGDVLSTCRVVTVRNEDNEPEVVEGLWRMATRPNAVADNFFSDGIFWTVGDLASGELANGITPQTTARQDTITRHPVTGRKMVGVRHPQWAAVRDLALAAHRLLPDLLACGWDVATTPEGPMLVELNVPADSLPRTTIVWDGMAEARFGKILAFHARRWLEANTPEDSRRRVGNPLS